MVGGVEKRNRHKSVGMEVPQLHRSSYSLDPHTFSSLPSSPPPPPLSLPSLAIHLLSCLLCSLFALRLENSGAFMCASAAMCERKGALE